jgi:hypothetical protein
MAWNGLIDQRFFDAETTKTQTLSNTKVHHLFNRAIPVSPHFTMRSARNLHLK